jgi:hypothetical protein
MAGTTLDVAALTTPEPSIDRPLQADSLLI